MFVNSALICCVENYQSAVTLIVLIGNNFIPNTSPVQDLDLFLTHLEDNLSVSVVSVIVQMGWEGRANGCEQCQHCHRPGLAGVPLVILSCYGGLLLDITVVEKA